MWFKKLKKKKLQMFLVGIILFVSALLFNMCLCFYMELSNFAEEGITTENCPDSYVVSVGSANINDLIKSKEYNKDIQDVKALTGKSISVPINFNGKDISMYYDMMLSVEELDDFEYFKTSGLEADDLELNQVILSETLAIPNHIKIGDKITIEYGTALELEVAGFYKSTCFPKAVGYSPIIVNKMLLDKIQEESAAYFAVRLNEYEADKLFDIFSDSQYCAIVRTRDSVKDNLTEFSVLFGSVGALAAMVVFLVALVIIGFIIKNNLIKELKVIGIYKSLGYTSGQIIGFYLKGYMLVGSISIAAGTAVSLIPAQIIGELCTGYMEGFRITGISLAVSIVSIALLFIILVFNLWKTLRRIKKITPVEAIAAGLVSSEVSLPQSIIKNAATPFQMAVNEIFKFKKSTIMTMLVLVVSIYFSILFAMVWNSSYKMLENCNLWFCLPANDTYVSGVIDNGVINYLENNQYVDSVVYGDFSTTQEAALKDYEEAGSIRYDAYSSFDNSKTGIKIISGRIPVDNFETLIGENLLKELQLNIGDQLEITIKGITNKCTITGTYDTVADNGRKIMFTTETLKLFMEDYVSTRAFIKLNDLDDYEAFKNEVETELSRVVVDKAWPAMENSVESIRMMLEVVAEILVLLFFLFSMLNIVTVALMNSVNSRRKNGILKSLGFTNEYLLKQNLLKYAMIAVVSAFIALVIHKLLSAKLLAALLVDAFLDSNLILALIMIIFIGIVLMITYIVSFSVKKISPVELMEE